MNDFDKLNYLVQRGIITIDDFSPQEKDIWQDLDEGFASFAGISLCMNLSPFYRGKAYTFTRALDKSNLSNETIKNLMVMFYSELLGSFEDLENNYEASLHTFVHFSS